MGMNVRVEEQRMAEKEMDCVKIYMTETDSIGSLCFRMYAIGFFIGQSAHQ